MVDKPNLEAFQALVELDKKERSLKFQQNYFSAYVLSAILAPIGIYYFIKFCFFSDGTREDIKAGIISLAITIIFFLFAVWFISYLFKGTINSLPVQNDTFKELITPEKQKKLKDLFQ